MAVITGTSEHILEFKYFDLSTKSLYIVEGTNSYGLYNINRAFNPSSKEQLLVFVLRGSLQIDLKNWETWRDCSSATYVVKRDDQGTVLNMTFDVNKMLTTSTHQVKYPTDKKGVHECVDQNTTMFILKETDFKITESEFPMKLKRDKAKTREIKNIISINYAHILETKTPIIKGAFLSNIDEPFVTRVQILDKSEKGNKKSTNKRKLDNIDSNVTKKKTKTDTAQINLVKNVQNVMAKASKDENEEKVIITKELKKKSTEEPSEKYDKQSENWSRKLEENKEETLENDKKPLTLTQENMLVLGLKLPLRDLTSEDTKSPPWTNLSRNLYREKKTLFDNKYASKWMRWWFEEHHEMPESPSNPARSGYAIYLYEKQTELKGFNNKKITKNIGAMWKQESEEVKSIYGKRSAQRKEQNEILNNAYEEEIEIWRKKKQTKPRRSDGMPDCNCQYCTEEETK